MAIRTVLLAALWTGLNPGDLGSWMVGVPVVALAAWTATALAADAPAGFRLRRFVRFLPFFLLASLRGGADVAWRALHPRLPIAPALLHHPLRLPAGTARTFLLNVVSLLPGSLSADLQDSTLVLHVLAGTRDVGRDIHAAERHVAGLFGIDLPAEADAES